MQDQILSLSSVSFQYYGNTVLQDISFTLNKGDKLVIVGPNGGGKSTLLQCIIGTLSKYYGTILYEGKSYENYTKRIGFVPQYPTHNTYILINVIDVVLLGKIQFYTSSAEKKAHKELACSLLEMVGLSHKGKHLFSDLSGGERQRVLIARALMSTPSLLLLDEPTASIDPKSRFCFYELLAQLDKTITIIMTTHDINAIDSSFTSLAVVNNTMIYQNNTTITPDILKALYGEHSHLCGIGTFVEKMLK